MTSWIESLGDGDELVLIVGGMAGALAVALVLAVIFSILRAREEVRRRAAESVGASTGTAAVASGGHPVDAGRQATARLLGLAEKLLGQADQKRAQILRRKLVQAGFYDNSAVTWFFGARVALCALIGVAAVGLLPVFFPDLGTGMLFAFCALAAVFGYALPSIFVGRRIDSRTMQVKAGFPDYMDLMVVCAEAGLSMEASIDRVAREIASSYPALAENLYITSLEIRAGKTVSEALDRLAGRLGVDEAKSFATLLQQSEELGSSVVHSLKIYSDDMRNKRLMKAEEKAYALPAKLVVPLTLFIFPVLLVVLLLPVVVRVSTANF